MSEWQVCDAYFLTTWILQSSGPCQQPVIRIASSCSLAGGKPYIDWLLPSVLLPFGFPTVTFWPGPRNLLSLYTNGSKTKDSKTTLKTASLYINGSKTKDNKTLH